MPTNALIYSSARDSKFPFVLTDFRQHPDALEELELDLLQPFHGLVINLEQPFHFDGPNLSRGVFATNACHLVTLPAETYTVTLPAGLHHTLALHVPLTILDRYAKDFAFLVPFIDLAQRGMPALLSETSLQLSPIVDQHLTELFHHVATDEELRMHLFDTKAFDIFHHALHDFAELLLPVVSYGDAHFRVIQRAARYLLDHITETITLEDLALEFGMSRRNLQAGFKKYFRRTVHEYVVQHRLDRAKKMLRNPETPVKSIAQAVGYKSVSHFTSAYKQYYHQSPTAGRIDSLIH